MSNEHSGLNADFQLFESHRQEWSQNNEGKYVVMHNGDILGFFDDYGSGLQAGIAKFGVATEFLVQQVCKEEPVFVIY
jgi:hypothetical protein